MDSQSMSGSRRRQERPDQIPARKKAERRAYWNKPIARGAQPTTRTQLMSLAKNDARIAVKKHASTATGTSGTLQLRRALVATTQRPTTAIQATSAFAG